MVNQYYKFITFFSRIFGYWFFAVFARLISAGYFILFPKRVAIGKRFYGALYPERSGLYHLWCTWRQFHSFTNVFLDRFLLEHGGDISYTSENWEVLEQSAEKGAAGIILMSHTGNWDVAANLLRKKGLNLLLYMGARQKEQVEKMQKDHLSERGFKIVSIEQDSGSPYDILEGLRFLKQGGLMAITGDRIWNSAQRTVPVSFLGHRTLLPEAPHAIALASGAPLLIFFAFRTGKGKYRISITKPIPVRAVSRMERQHAIQESVQHYADLLAGKVREFPFQWYHFEEFLKERL